MKSSSKKWSRPLSKRIGYWLLQRFLQILFFLAFRLRFHHRDRIPVEGGGLVCSNHQSHLDPPMIGCALSRRLNYLAKKSLFNNRYFGWFISFLDAIPLDREGMGVVGIKETLKRLKRGELVLIFPEGSRTFDGQFDEFHGGFIVLARRTKVPLIPVGIDGAFQAWPRTRPMPTAGRVAISVGEPIPYDQYRDLTDEQLIELLESRIRHEFEFCQASVA